MRSETAGRTYLRHLHCVAFFVFGLRRNIGEIVRFALTILNTLHRREELYFPQCVAINNARSFMDETVRGGCPRFQFNLISQNISTQNKTVFVQVGLGCVTLDDTGWTVDDYLRFKTSQLTRSLPAMLMLDNWFKFGYLPNGKLTDWGITNTFHAVKFTGF